MKLYWSLQRLPRTSPESLWRRPQALISSHVALVGANAPQRCQNLYQISPLHSKKYQKLPQTLKKHIKCLQRNRIFATRDYGISFCWDLRAQPESVCKVSGFRCEPSVPVAALPMGHRHHRRPCSISFFLSFLYSIVASASCAFCYGSDLLTRLR